ncbi:MAG: family 16 glycosylhydrolase [Bacteroidetes bacterium]|nr:family 16 glycosylhydrolase [Bacteroidota bacterium]
MKTFYKLIIIGLLLLVATHKGHTQNSATHKAYKTNWRLVFYDEFDSLGLNPQKWSNSYPWGRWVGGQQYYTNGQNLYFDGSHFNIKVDDDTLTGFVMNWDSLGNYTPYYKHFDYTSGMIYSNRDFKYGYFETKVKVPKGKSFNSAFWLYGLNNCEIDVFEILGSTTNNALMTLHWKTPDSITNSKQSVYSKYSVDTNYSDKYYTFGVKWKKNELKWYVDTNEVIEDFYTRLVRSRHIPDVKMNLIYTLAVGPMDGSPDSTTIFPSYFNIDYVRAYSDDTVPPPLITGQIPVSMSFNSTLAIIPSMLKVADFYHVYPAGFKVIVLPGNNYSLNGNVITPLYNYEDTLYVQVKVNDGIDNSPVFNLLVRVPDATSIKENIKTNGLNIYPNPVKDFLEIKFISKDESIVFIDIFDAKGLKYLHKKTNLQQKIDVSSLQQGIYYISISTDKQKRTLKFVKE